MNVAVCIHCGHPMEMHGRRVHLTMTLYRCQSLGCHCEYELVHAE